MMNGKRPYTSEDSVTLRLVRVSPEAVHALAVPAPEAARLLCVEVSVRSKTKPLSSIVGRIWTQDFKSQDDARKRVETLAGALAEKIAERLKDGLIDPDLCARQAGEAWSALLLMPKTEIAEL